MLWDDNYVTLLPGEKREIGARYAAKDLGDAQAGGRARRLERRGSGHSVTQLRRFKT